MKFFITRKDEKNKILIPLIEDGGKCGIRTHASRMWSACLVGKSLKPYLGNFPHAHYFKALTMENCLVSLPING